MEPTGRTLHADTVHTQCRQLQEHARELREAALELRTRARARRVALLAITAAALWFSALIVLLDQQ